MSRTSWRARCPGFAQDTCGWTNNRNQPRPVYIFQDHRLFLRCLFRHQRLDCFVAHGAALQTLSERISVHVVDCCHPSALRACPSDRLSLNTTYSNRTGLARTIFKIFRSVFSAHIPVQAAAAYQADRAAFALGSVAFFGLLLHGDALLLQSGIFRLLRTHCQ